MCIRDSHYTMKAAMEGMLEHGMANFKDQSVAYSFETAPASGIESFSASGMWDPQAYLALENKFAGGDKEYTIATVTSSPMAALLGNSSSQCVSTPPMTLGMRCV